MGTYHNYHDVPYVHVNEDAALEDHCWSTYGIESGPLHLAHRFNKTINVFGNDIPMNNPPSLDMTNMERFIDSPVPFSGLFHAGFTRPIGSPPPHHPYYANYNFTTQPPYPPLAEYHRAHSPSATSSSESQTSSPNEDFKPMHMTPIHGYGSPPDSDSGRMWPGEQTYAAPIHGGGSCIALPEIQGVPDQVPDHHAEGQGRSNLQIEFELFTPKMEVDNDQYAEEDSACAHIPDAESVHWHNHDEDKSDSDYKPSRASKRVRKRTFSGSSQDFTSKAGVKKVTHARIPSSVSNPENRKKKPRRGDKANCSASTKNGGDASRPFPCPLAIYSCNSTFSSKNEWKRHVSTQHVRIGFWRCDLCPPSHDVTQTSVYYNDFNRKDLFTQHLRRMHSTTSTDPKHAPVSSEGPELPPVNENTIPAHQNRCFRRLRSPPPTSSCLFCPRTFSGLGSWEERMEHVGKHFEKDKKGTVEIANWRDDIALEKWFIREGLVEKNGEQGWRLGDGVPKRSRGEDEDDLDVDADGEEEDE